PIAPGRVPGLDLAPARAMPGVRAAIARAAIPAISLDAGELFDPAVRYAGQPVAAVCADTPELARRAIAAIVIGFAAEPHAVTTADALAKNAPRVQPAGNLHGAPHVHSRGDAERAMRTAPVVITREYRTASQLHS